MVPGLKVRYLTAEGYVTERMIPHAVRSMTRKRKSTVIRSNYKPCASTIIGWLHGNSALLATPIIPRVDHQWSPMIWVHMAGVNLLHATEVALTVGD